MQTIREDKSEMSRGMPLLDFLQLSFVYCFTMLNSSEHNSTKRDKSFNNRTGLKEGKEQLNNLQSVYGDLDPERETQQPSTGRGKVFLSLYWFFIAVCIVKCKRRRKRAKKKVLFGEIVRFQAGSAREPADDGLLFRRHHQLPGDCLLHSLVLPSEASVARGNFHYLPMESFSHARKVFLSQLIWLAADDACNESSSWRWGVDWCWLVLLVTVCVLKSSVEQTVGRRVGVIVSSSIFGDE